MNALTPARRSPAQRLGWATIGAASSTIGVLVAYQLSGFTIDLELIAIVALATLGIWFLLTAALAGRKELRVGGARRQGGGAPVDTVGEPERSDA